MSILRKEKLESIFKEVETFINGFRSVMESNSSSMRDNFVNDNKENIKKIIESLKTISNGTLNDVFTGAGNEDAMEITIIKKRALDYETEMTKLLNNFKEEFIKEATETEFEAPVVSKETIEAAQKMSDSMQVMAKDMEQATKDTEAAAKVAAQNATTATKFAVQNATTNAFNYSYALCVGGNVIIIPSMPEDETIKTIQQYLKPGVSYELYELTAKKKTIKLSIV